VPPHTSYRSRAAGFTLIEALVALVVLSIGLLGVAGLQLTGLRASSSAGSRTQASYLADDILDRMRANRSDALAGKYDVTLGVARSGTAMSDVDVEAWQTDLSSSLPVGQGSIQTDTVTGLVTVIIQWVDSHGGDATECTGPLLATCSPLQFQTQAQL
jgi:type IV pilus assembly protein PilV